MDLCRIFVRCFIVLLSMSHVFITGRGDWCPIPGTPRVSVILILSSIDFCAIIRLRNFPPVRRCIFGANFAHIEGSVHKGSISIYFRFWVFYTIRQISTSPTNL